MVTSGVFRLPSASTGSEHDAEELVSLISLELWPPLGAMAIGVNKGEPIARWVVDQVALKGRYAKLAAGGEFGSSSGPGLEVVSES